MTRFCYIYSHSGAVLVSTEFFDCREHVEDDAWPLKTRIKNIKANRLNEIAAVDFEFALGEESVSELALA